MATNRDITRIPQRACPSSFGELIEAICDSDACGQDQSFERLDESVELTRDIVDKTLPCIWKKPLAAGEVLPQLDLLLLQSVKQVRSKDAQSLHNRRC